MVHRVALRVPPFLLVFFLLVVGAMIAWNFLHDAIVPADRILSGQSVYTVLPPDYDFAADPVKYGRIHGIYDGTLIFPDPSSARLYLQRTGLEERRWQIYALVGDYQDDTYVLGKYHYSKVAMTVKAQVAY